MKLLVYERQQTLTLFFARTGCLYTIIGLSLVTVELSVQYSLCSSLCSLFESDITTLLEFCLMKYWTFFTLISSFSLVSAKEKEKERLTAGCHQHRNDFS